MTRGSSNHHFSLRALALLGVIIAAPAACTLDRAGLEPSGAGGSTSTSAATASSTSGTGGAMMCNPGAITACYDGPAATQDKGACQSGQHTCNAQGNGFDACINQVLPAAKDDCAAGTDTNCNGTFECGCMPGSMAICYDGVAATENVGACKSGKHTCQADTKTYGACTGQVLPAPENCVSTLIDEDCDGKKPLCTGTTVGGASVGGNQDDDMIFGVAADPSGNILLGGVTGAAPPSGGYFDVSSGSGFVSRVGLHGASSWTSAMSSTEAFAYSVVRGVASDAKGNVFVVGELKGSTSGVNINVNSAGGVDIFLAKLDPAGTTVWAKSFGNGSDQYGNGVTVDTSGNVIITGRTSFSVDFGGGPRTGGGGDDLFVAKFDSDGKHLWSRALGDFNGQIGFGVAATPNGDVVVTGEVRGAMNFGGGVSVTSAGEADVFVARLAGGDGAAKWAHRYGDDKDQTAHAVAAGSNGSIVVTGSMTGKCDFGAGNLDAKSQANAFVAKLNSDGSTDWSYDYGDDNNNQRGTGIAIDPAQNIVVVGYFSGSVTFGATVLTDVDGNNAQNTDIFVAKLAANGSSVWARQFGDLSDQGAWAVATDSASSVIVGGTYAGTVSLPPAITSKGGYDAFWAKLAP